MFNMFMYLPFSKIMMNFNLYLLHSAYVNLFLILKKKNTIDKRQLIPKCFKITQKIKLTRIHGFWK